MNNAIRHLLLAGICFVAASAGAESLYREGGYKALTADNKAFRVGDILTVQVVEQASATTSTETGTQRKNQIGAEAMYGKDKTSRFGINTHGDFNGGGTTQRANRVLATLSVTVREVLPSGDLWVAGEQKLVVNQEPQTVSLEGRVRPVDISDGNIVLSPRLADARISLTGEGLLTERSQRPWWRKLLDWMGL